MRSYLLRVYPTGADSVNQLESAKQWGRRRAIDSRVRPGIKIVALLLIGKSLGIAILEHRFHQRS